MKGFKSHTIRITAPVRYLYTIQAMNALDTMDSLDTGWMQLAQKIHGHILRDCQ